MSTSRTTTLLVALTALLVPPDAARGQALDETVVPRGQLRLQAHPRFSSWDEWFGPDGERIPIGERLNAANSALLFPGTSTLTSAVREFGGLPDWDPVLGPTAGRVQQEVTVIDFGGDVGVFDWLSVGVTVPWSRTRTAIDVFHTPDTLSGNLGANPRLTDMASVDAFLASAATAAVSARVHADATCGGGSGPACTAALDLAARTEGFSEALTTAYTTALFFPLAGTGAASGLDATLSGLNAELAAATLPGFLPLVTSAEVLSEDGIRLLPAVPGTGIDAAPLNTRRGLWSVGDVEARVRFRLLDTTTRSGRPGSGPVRYRLIGRFTTRFATGTREDPNVVFDTGTGDAQMDLEAALAGEIRFGAHMGLAAYAFATEQAGRTIDMRVASARDPFPSGATLREVTWKPGRRVGYSVSPLLRLGSTVVLHGEYRRLHRFRDQVTLVVDDGAVDPFVVEMESGVKQQQIGGGLRYDSVEPWLRGEAPRPMEIHLRFVHTFEGSGGLAPAVTRVEAGLRLFRTLWGR